MPNLALVLTHNRASLQNRQQVTAIANLVVSRSQVLLDQDGIPEGTEYWYELSGLSIPHFAISATTGGDPDFVVRIMAASGGTVEESANVSGAGSTTYISYKTATPYVAPLTIYDLPGASTTAWTKTDLGTMQIGIRETVTDTHFVRVSELAALVFWHAAVAGVTATSTIMMMTGVGQ